MAVCGARRVPCSCGCAPLWREKRGGVSLRKGCSFLPRKHRVLELHLPTRPLFPASHQGASCPNMHAVFHAVGRSSDSYSLWYWPYLSKALSAFLALFLISSHGSGHSFVQKVFQHILCILCPACIFLSSVTCSHFLSASPHPLFVLLQPVFVSCCV